MERPCLGPTGAKPDKPFVYHGFYRHGKRVVFAYRIGDVEMLDAPWVENGRFTRVVAPAATASAGARRRAAGPRSGRRSSQRKGAWAAPAPGLRGRHDRAAVHNPWNALLFFGDHDFFADGTAMLCTMQGDVWRVEGLDETLEQVRWRRFASGLHQALGLVIADGTVYVLGRDQITRLARPERRRRGRFLRVLLQCLSDLRRPATTSSAACSATRPAASTPPRASQGLLRIAADGRSVEVLATGFRNPDGLGLAPDGTVTVPNSEGEWVPTSMICEVRPGGHYGYPGPKNDRPPDLPLVYLPRGLDNSSGAQVTVPDGRFGPLAGPVDPLLVWHGHAFSRAAREGRRPAPGGGRAVARRLSLGRAPGTVQSQGRTALCHREWPAGAPTPRPTAAFSACATPGGRSSSRSPSTPTKTVCC